MRRPTRNKIIAGGLVTAMCVGIGSATASACGLTDIFGLGGFMGLGGGLWGGRSTSTIGMSQQQVLEAKISVVQQAFGTRYRVSSMHDLAALICQLPDRRRNSIGLMLGLGAIHVSGGGSMGWRGTTANGGDLAMALQQTHVNNLITIASMIMNSQISTGGGMALGGMSVIVEGALGTKYTTWTQVARHLKTRQSTSFWMQMRGYLGSSVSWTTSESVLAAKLQKLTAQQLMNLMWAWKADGGSTGHNSGTVGRPPAPNSRPDGFPNVVTLPDIGYTHCAEGWIWDEKGKCVPNGKDRYPETTIPAMETDLSQRLNIILSANGRDFAVTSYADLAAKVIKADKVNEVLAALSISTYADASSMSTATLAGLLKGRSTQQLMMVAGITSGFYAVRGSSIYTNSVPVTLPATEDGGSTSHSVGADTAIIPPYTQGDRIPEQDAWAISEAFGVSASSITTYQQLAVLMAQLPPRKLMAVQQTLGLDLFGNASFGFSGASLTNTLAAKLRTCGLSTLMQVGRLVTGGFGFGGSLSGSIGLGVGFAGGAGASVGSTSNWGSFAQARQKQYAIPFCQGSGAVRQWHRNYGGGWNNFDDFVNRHESIIDGMSRGTINATIATPFLLQGLASFSSSAGWNEAYSATSNTLVGGCGR